MKVHAVAERWPLAAPFAIARGAKDHAEVVVAAIDDGRWQGRGECVPYARYGETAAGVLADLDGFRGPFDRRALLTAMPPGAARNAIDCALWDLAAQRSGRPAWELASVPPPSPRATAYTLSLDEPPAMAAAAAAVRCRPLLKLKLGRGGIDADIARLRAVRRACPARLVVDANEAWSLAELEAFMPAAQAAGVALVEQPLPAAEDAALAGRRFPIPLAADESVHDGANLAEVAERYQAVNIKLDKAGGLTQALALAREAQALRLDIVLGCMVATSLAMAPALLLAHFAEVVDLDGPLLLARDRSPGLAYRGEQVAWRRGVWGGASRIAEARPTPCAVPAPRG